jgi:hypothetical protein
MQSAEAKFHSTVVGFLVPLLVLGVVKLAPLFATLSTSFLVAGTIAAALASAGSYKILSLVLAKLLRKSEWLKRFILGPSYLNGTWVGWFIGHNKDVRYIVEVFEQDLGGVNTRGMSFNEAGETHGEWRSEATLIDPVKGQLLYTCSADILTADVPFRSIAVFNFERRGSDDPPHALDGHVADVHDGVRLEIREVKIASTLLGFREALPKAREIRRQGKGTP